jgi:iron complex outermembrane recepter protein
MRSFRLFLISCCPLAGAAMPALAQNVAVPDVEVLTEVVVTASKRAERMHDVPASVSAVKADSLAQIGAVRFEDYVARVPGLVVDNTSSGGGLNQLSIRGVTTGVGGNPTVGFYIDEAPFGSSTVLGGGAVLAPDIDPSDLERIEVLRGPQGTLYGAGSMGGLVKFVTATPDFSGFSARVQLDGSSVDDGATGYGARAMVNIPIDDSLALRASGFTREDPGFIDDVASGEKDLNDSRINGGRISLAWQPNASWTARLSALTQRLDGDGTPTIDASAATFMPLYGDLQHVRAPGTDTVNATYNLYDLTLDGDLSGINLVSATSYGTLDADINTDYTPVIGPLLDAVFGVPGGGAAIVTDGGVDKFTQELRLTSSSENRLAWQVGAFYTRERSKSVQSLPIFDASTGEPLPIALPPLLDSTLPSQFEELAVFGNATWKITPRFDVTAGLRYSENDQSATVSTAGLLIGPASSSKLASDEGAFTYLLTPRFHVNDAVMVYGRIATGYRPGGPNIVVPGVAPTFDHDTTINYEAGIKADLLGRTVSLELALFQIDWSDIQLRQISTVGTQYFDNGGDARSRGAEASVAWRPLAGLQIAGNVSYIDAKLMEDLSSSLYGLKDAALPGTPDWSGQLSIDYQVAFGAWTALAGAGYRYVDDRLADFQPSPLLQRFPLASYDVVDLRAGVQRDRWTLTAYAKNVGDARGEVTAFPLGGIYSVSIIQPRTLGVSLAVDF